MLKYWSNKLWLYVMYTIGAVMTIFLIIHWNDWTFPIKFMALSTIILPAHVFEEWQFPAGFHYQYNTSKGTEEKSLNCYPMNRLTDMITNFVGELMFILLILINFDKNGVVLAITFFSFLECFIHTKFGILMWKKLKEKGKRTIYGPGSATAYLGFGPLLVIGIYYLAHIGITVGSLMTAILLLFIMLVGMIVIPEGLLKRKDNKYTFPNAGYYENFLNK